MVRPCKLERAERVTEVDGRLRVRDLLTGDWFLGLGVNKRIGSLKVVQKSSPLLKSPVGGKWPNPGAGRRLVLVDTGYHADSGSLQPSLHVLLLAAHLVAGRIVVPREPWTWMWLIR
jgi:hypothetical protein